MSRRKQTSPQQILSDEIIAYELETGIQPDSPTAAEDAHVCGKCRADFDTLPDFLAHKKACSQKRIVLINEADQSNDDQCKDLTEDTVLDSGAESGKEDDHSDNPVGGDKTTSDNTGLTEASKEERLSGTLSAISADNMNSNVFLEPLATTKAAVQQFAENNVPPSDLAVLHSTLFSLQQQQLIQLQLIQQLQTQLTNNERAPQAMVTPMVQLPHTDGAVPATSATADGEQQASPPMSSFEALRKEAEKIITSCASPLTPLLTSESERKVPPNVTVASAKSDNATGDPFFKHKCRYCLKVFGSDSALQIHLRSHTGERPFKCNICGNRFSTRGNLKVHFMRHRAKYPHVRMNGTPVPEYLDKRASASASSSMFGGPLALPAPAEKEDSPMPAVPSSGPSSGSSASPPMESRKHDLTMRLPETMFSSAPTLSIPEYCHASSAALPTFSNPLMRSAGMLGGFHGSMLPVPPPVSSFPPVPGLLRPSILPPDNAESDSMEEFMEISKSETDKLQQLVESLNTKVSDPNQCVICHRILSCKSALQMHYRTHTGERPYKCKLCSRAFTTKGNLKTHMGVHRSKPPLRMMHQCPVCHKQFTNALVLQQHIRMHTESASGLTMPRITYPPTSMAPTSENGELDLRINRPLSTSLHSPNDADSSRSQSVKSEPADDRMDRPESNGGSEPRSTPSSMSPPPKSASVLSSSYLDMSGNPPSFVSPYSTSLAALEERVRAMDSQLKQAPMSRPWEQEPRYTLLSPNVDKTKETSHQLKIVTEDVDKDQENKDDEPLNLGKPVAKHPEMLQGDSAPTSPMSSEGQPRTPEPKHEGEGHTALSPYADSNASIETNPAGGDANKTGDSLTPTTCNICFKSFACRSALEIHYRMHTKERPYNCEVCGRGFTTKGNMRQHMLTHKIRDLPSEAFEPVMSPASSEASSALSEVKAETTQATETTPAPPKRPYPAENGQSQTTPPPKRPLAKHQCSVCYKPFSSASALQIHFRTHTGDKPYKCTVCGKAFTTKGNLKVHMGTHMWNNGATRRGRRVSVENVNLLPSNMVPNKDFSRPPPISPFPAPSPDMFFPYPPFMNGFSPNKMNDLPLMPGMAGLPPVSAAEALMQMQASTAQAMIKAGYMPMLPGFPPMSSANDLAKLSASYMHDGEAKSPEEGSQRGPSVSPTSSDKESPKAAWAWKTTCYVCNKVCSSVSSLDQHMKMAHGPPSDSALPVAATS